MNKFPKNSGRIYMESSVLPGNTDIYIHHIEPGGIKTVLTIENQDVCGALRAFMALGYKVSPMFCDE